jgi:hypothetical protein
MLQEPGATDAPLARDGDAAPCIEQLLNLFAVSCAPKELRLVKVGWVGNSTRPGGSLLESNITASPCMR